MNRSWAPRSLVGRCIMVHNALMTSNAALTVRLPATLRKQLEARAEAEHRSLSAQLVAELSRAPAETDQHSGNGGRFLGRYSDTTEPSDADLAEVRANLWGQLPHRASD